MSTVSVTSEEDSLNLDDETKEQLRKLVSEKQYAEVEVYDLDRNDKHPIQSAVEGRQYSNSTVPLIDGDEDVEYLAKRAYEIAGFKVLRTDTTKSFPGQVEKGRIPHSVVDELGRKVAEHTERFNEDDEEGRFTYASSIFSGRGIPDLFVWNTAPGGDVSQMFFVEVKSERDSLRRSQLRWMMNQGYLKRRVAYVEVKDYE
ncbi:VRR-NUC domain-containing protein [Haloarcula vallismortis]|uniref:VRR-NUC domain-containing protein n=2 Tax=Haloarcula vallismortis TaxID=28442 RepID=M0JPQ5_HALVA|nr:VRR-NUC domain-containing protein [Haloarcula vallismortis]EMA09954.1 hypothetical protein C437_04835 [Haloarcula vallismortis ATCC 29715]SDX27834.1 VRR-NUC domain-containing protein [Haloarcula vallismortis]